MLSSKSSYLLIVVIGFVLVLFGFVVPFLMCIKLVPPNLVLEFLSFTASVTGVLMGIVGVSWYTEIPLQ